MDEQRKALAAKLQEQKKIFILVGLKVEIAIVGKE